MYLGVRTFLLTHNNAYYFAQGSYAGNAPGFRLATLVGVWETRSNLAGLTLLHHIVQIAQRDELDILDFTEELGDLSAVVRYFALTN